MGLSTYMVATKAFYESMDSEFGSVWRGLEDILPLDIGQRHNATRNIEITIPIATWHKGHSVDDYLWQKAYMPESDEYVLDLDREGIVYIINDARRIQAEPDSFVGEVADEEKSEWVVTQFQRLERALTDFLLDDRLNGFTLKVWRSY